MKPNAYIMGNKVSLGDHHYAYAQPYELQPISRMESHGSVL